MRLFYLMYLYCPKTRNKNDKNGANKKNIEWLRMSIKSDLLKKSCGKKKYMILFFFGRKKSCEKKKA